MKRNKFADFGKYDGNFYSPGRGKRNMSGAEANAVKNQLAKMANNPIGKIASAGKKAVGAVKANPGKAGLALAGLAAAGGLGMAGKKALDGRKPKTLQDRIKKAANSNPMLNKASKMFR